MENVMIFILFISSNNFYKYKFLAGLATSESPVDTNVYTIRYSKGVPPGRPVNDLRYLVKH